MNEPHPEGLEEGEQAISDDVSRSSQRICSECKRPSTDDARFCAFCGFVLDEEAPPLGDPLIGQTIADRYHLISLVGRGGMGVVYRAEHAHLNKTMALKLLHGQLAKDKTYVKRFRREAEAVSRLNHPNTVQVFDFGWTDGLMYLAMEYLDGEDLGVILKREGHLPVERAFRIALQICASLEEAHGLGIVHRDLKPENVHILPANDQRGEVAKVLDFGLAKLRDEGGGNQQQITLTRAGAIVGTPYYMAPEQIRGDPVDQRGDIYALGAMLYKLLTGVPPYRASTPVGVLTKHLTESLTLPSARNKELPPEVDRILAKALEKDPRDRYPSVQALAADLRAYLSEGSPSHPSHSTSKVLLQERKDTSTRREVDAYESKLRRRGFLVYLFLFAVIAGLGALGWRQYQLYLAANFIPTHELEPNHTTAEALLLPPNTEVRGRIGRRISDVDGDIDVYRIDGSNISGSLLNLTITGLPNIDLVAELKRHGAESPLLVLDTGPAGMSERIVNFPLQQREYYVFVHERRIQGQAPTENVSDEYIISWSTTPLQPQMEQEVNNSLELANLLEEVPTEIRGYIGWAGDSDSYCFTQDFGDVEIELTPISNLDLVLRSVDRSQNRSRKYDEGGVGEGEGFVFTGVRTAVSCVEVSMDETDSHPYRGNFEETYTLRVSVAP